MKACIILLAAFILTGCSLNVNVDVARNTQKPMAIGFPMPQPQ